MHILQNLIFYTQNLLACIFPISYFPFSRVKLWEKNFKSYLSIFSFVFLPILTTSMVRKVSFFMKMLITVELEAEQVHEVSFYYSATLGICQEKFIIKKKFFKQLFPTARIITLFYFCQFFSHPFHVPVEETLAQEAKATLLLHVSPCVSPTKLSHNIFCFGPGENSQ